MLARGEVPGFLGGFQVEKPWRIGIASCSAVAMVELEEKRRLLCYELYMAVVKVQHHTCKNCWDVKIKVHAVDLKMGRPTTHVGVEREGSWNISSR